MWDISITGAAVQGWSLEVVISFSKINFGIWVWGLADSFWDHIIQISKRVMNFHDIYSQPWKVKIQVTIYFLSSNSYFRGVVTDVLYGFIYDTDQAKIYSLHVPAACLEARRPRRPTSSWPDIVLGQFKNLQCTCTCSLPRGKVAQEAHQQLAWHCPGPI